MKLASVARYQVLRRPGSLPGSGVVVKEADGAGEDDRLMLWLFGPLVGVVVHRVEAVRGVLDLGGISERLWGLRSRKTNDRLLPHEVDVADHAGNAEVVPAGQRAALPVLGVPLCAFEAQLVGDFALGRL